jgi:hypothetical protein
MVNGFSGRCNPAVDATFASFFIAVCAGSMWATGGFVSNKSSVKRNNGFTASGAG